jgi:hypothetical protein
MAGGLCFDICCRDALHSDVVESEGSTEVVLGGDNVGVCLVLLLPI